MRNNPKRRTKNLTWINPISPNNSVLPCTSRWFSSSM